MFYMKIIKLQAYQTKISRLWYHVNEGYIPTNAGEYVKKYFETPDQDTHYGRRTLSCTLSLSEDTRLNGRPSLSSKRTPLESQRFHHL